MQMTKLAVNDSDTPDKLVSTDKLFGFKWHAQVPARSPSSPASPTTAASWSRAITAPASRPTSSRWRRGSTGRCVRVNLDSHVSRIDLVGKDAIVLKDGKQVTEFREGILPWALQHRSRWCSTNTTPAAGRDVRDPARAGGSGQADPARPEPVIRRTRRSACSRPPTPSASATPPASITAPSRSTRARWTAGRSSPR
jgi:hypothetical protein